MGEVLLTDTGRVVVPEEALEQLGELDMLLQGFAVPLTERNLCVASRRDDIDQAAIAFIFDVSEAVEIVSVVADWHLGAAGDITGGGGVCGLSVADTGTLTGSAGA